MLQQFLQKEIFNNTIQDYLIFILIILCSFVVLRIIQIIIIKKIKNWALKTKTTVDDMLIRNVEKNIPALLYLLMFFLSFRFLEINPKIAYAINILSVVLISFLFFRFFISLINELIKYFLFKKHGEQSSENYHSLSTILTIILWSIGILLVLNNLGYNITALIAGLGVGGIAIALAAQAIFGDVISYFVILLDKPFRVGDFIIIDDKSGTIENIGIKTTRIKSLRGEQIILANSDITKSRIHNFERMEDRRHQFLLHIRYETPVEKIKMIPEIIKTVIDGTDQARFDVAALKEFDTSALLFEVIYYVNYPTYKDFLTINDQIHVRILESLAKEQIQLAYPISRIIIEK